MRKLFLLVIVSLVISSAKSQVKTPTLYVSGNVLSEEKVLVTVAGTKTIEGNVVSAEINGKKTEARTDGKGHALLDISSIATDVAVPTLLVVNSFDKDGNLISTAKTTIHKGKPSAVPPVIERLPRNVPKNEVITIPGEHLGAGAKLVVGSETQETLSGSDQEMTVVTTAKTGEQPVYVRTPNGVSETQNVNIYSLEFDLAKNSITPGENVQAKVRYESIPVGTKLIFTNKSTETISMTIPGGQTSGSESIYTVSETNGTFPVNITGITRGNFIIALDFGFKNEPEIKELKNSFSKLSEYDQKVMFGFMSPESKCALWKDHLKESLKTPMKADQKELIEELDSRLKPEIFGTTSTASEFKTYAVSWVTKARAAFTGTDEVKLANMVTRLGGNHVANTVDDENIPDCDCVRNGAILNCPIYFTCRTRNCRTNWCGVFWLWTCDAQCI
jgi:hypothetical protein